MSGDATLAPYNNLITALGVDGASGGPNFVHGYLEIEKHSCNDADSEDSCIDGTNNVPVTLVVDETMPTATIDSAATKSPTTGPVRKYDENGC